MPAVVSISSKSVAKELTKCTLGGHRVAGWGKRGRLWGSGFGRIRPHYAAKVHGWMWLLAEF